MLSKPRKFITQFVEAGAANITIHVECEDQIRTALDEIAYYSCKVGLAVKPETPLSAVKEYLNVIDRLLIMTVKPGFGGQKFMADMMPKVQEAVKLREEGKFRYDIEVDGGLDHQTIWDAVRAGAEVIVAGTSVFSQLDLAYAVMRPARKCARGARLLGCAGGIGQLGRRRLGYSAPSARECPKAGSGSGSPAGRPRWLTRASPRAAPPGDKQSAPRRARPTRRWHRAWPSYRS